jgi:arylsulfatase A-like enzyme
VSRARGGRPNILFINVDQQRYDCLGFTGGQAATPALDALAGASVAFSSAFTPCPVCAPARQALLSGALPGTAAGGQQGLWNYDSGIPASSLAPAPHHWPLRLREAGYRMEWVGKWHANPAAGPAAWGYAAHTPPAKLPREAVRRLYDVSEPGEASPVGCFADLPLDDAPTHRLAAAAAAAIERLAAGRGPWHVMVDFPEPHLPCLPSGPFARMYDPADIAPWANFDERFQGKPLIQRRQLESWGIASWGWHEWAIYLAGYLGIVSQLDDAIGRILATLDEVGAREDTVVVYTTDHGDAAGSHRMMDKHYTMYEELVHVPLLVSWPAGFAGGRSCDDFVSHYLDLGPTLLEVAGRAGRDAGPGAGQGRSLVAALEGRALEEPREAVVATYSGQQFGLFSQRMIRDRRHKYVWNPTDVDELYDLEADPAELRNLAGDPGCGDLVRGLRQRLYETFAALGDGLVTNRWMRRQLGGA